MKESLSKFSGQGQETDIFELANFIWQSKKFALTGLLLGIVFGYALYTFAFRKTTVTHLPVAVADTVTVSADEIVTELNKILSTEPNVSAVFEHWVRSPEAADYAARSGWDHGAFETAQLVEGGQRPVKFVTTGRGRIDLVMASRAPDAEGVNARSFLASLKSYLATSDLTDYLAPKEVERRQQSATIPTYQSVLAKRIAEQAEVQADLFALENSLQKEFHISQASEAVKLAKESGQPAVDTSTRILKIVGTLIDEQRISGERRHQILARLAELKAQEAIAKLKADATTRAADKNVVEFIAYDATREIKPKTFNATELSVDETAVASLAGAKLLQTGDSRKLALIALFGGVGMVFAVLIYGAKSRFSATKERLKPVLQ